MVGSDDSFSFGAKCLFSGALAMLVSGSVNVLVIGCFSWMIPNLYIKKWLFHQTSINLAILLVPFLGWCFVTPSKVVCDLQRLGMKRSRLESPGKYVFLGFDLSTPQKSCEFLPVRWTCVRRIPKWLHARRSGNSCWTQPTENATILGGVVEGEEWSIRLMVQKSGGHVTSWRW